MKHTEHTSFLQGVSTGWLTHKIHCRSTNVTVDDDRKREMDRGHDCS